MPDVVTARDLLLETAAVAGLAPDLLDEIFEGAPLDFPVHFAPSLPFSVHRFGMAGITLFARVHLLAAVRAYPAAQLIALLRHEAEHVRQQRAGGGWFYPKYLWDWGREFLRPQRRTDDVTGRSRTARWHRAYTNIPYEREAYAAGNRALDLLNRK